MSTPPRVVSAFIDADITGTSEIELQIAVAKLPGLDMDETLEIFLDGNPVDPEELSSNVGGRIHRLSATDAKLTVAYRARVSGQAAPQPALPLDRSTYLRPSRYADSDRMFGFVAGQFALDQTPAALARDIAGFVSERLIYEPGSSTPTDGAADTLLGGAGVCRDYSHLTVALLRAANIPARLVAVYAPGCDPMDFHAVTEVLYDGHWHCLDTTALAPRQSLLRIATGRDAADTAFLDNHGGMLSLNAATVTAVVDGDLPIDNGAEDIAIR